jgi:hypothetical protein
MATPCKRVAKPSFRRKRTLRLPADEERYRWRLERAESLRCGPKKTSLRSGGQAR